MKKIFTAISILITVAAKAQTVNIPDAAFKNWLLNQANINTNGDGEIQESEAQAVTDIYIVGVTVTDLTGIRSFTNLERLTCWGNQLTFIDVSGLSHLQQLTCDNNIITNLNFSGCNQLSFLACAGNRLTNIDIRGLNNLERIVFGDNAAGCNLIASGCSKLKYASANTSNTSMGLIDLQNCDSLTTVDMDYTYIETLNISRCHTIRHLNFAFIIQNLIARDCSALESINTGFTSVGIGNSLDVTNCMHLQGIYLQEANIQRLDLSSCINLKSFSIYADGQGLKYLNLKNGSSLTTFSLGGISGSNANILNICADDFEIADIRNFLSSYPVAVNISSYCTDFPGGSYNTITGKVLADMNTNGCDSSDNAAPQLAIRVTDGTGNVVVRYSQATGNYAHYTYGGLYTMEPYFPYPYFAVSPLSTTVNFDTANYLTETRNFCVFPLGTYNDLSITLLPTWPLARPGFAASYALTYKNRGTTTLSGNVSVNFDNSKINFIAASENVSSQSARQLIWNYSNLQPFETRTIYLSFDILPPPVNNIGDTIQYLAAITPSDNDETPFDNSFILPQRVVASFDPNDKLCIEGSRIDISKIGDYLHYIIHFQNEGTDTAFNIVIADTLSNNLDWNSFEFISSSHACDPVLKNNEAAFYFSNINLPYKAINEAASNGWVAFKIKPKASLVIGDSINNTAAIYFDFNAPVVTNRATTVVSSSSVPVPVKLEYVSIAQKNNSNILNWKASCTYGNTTFVIERSEDAIHFSAIGNISATTVRCQLPFTFTDNSPAAGKNYYRIKIIDVDGTFFYSKILAAGNNKAGITITAVTNNTVYVSSNKQQPVTVKVFAVDGREVLHQTQIIMTGNNSISLPANNAARGIYTLVLYTADENTVTKKLFY